MREEVQIGGGSAITMEEAMQAAARAWCGEKTKHKVMDPALAMEFAKILYKEVNSRELEGGGGECPETVFSGIKGKAIPFAPEQISYFNIGEDRKSFQP